MIPLRDDNPTSVVPYVTLLIIALNLIVFGYELSLAAGEIERFFMTWGFVPALLSRGEVAAGVLTMVTSMFLHGGLVHLGGNMLYLWVFGDNIEAELGHGRFLLFYVGTGAAGSLSQYMMAPGSGVPMVGASGAIAGVLGAYMLLYPTARVLTLLFLFIVVRFVYLPAGVLLGFWILLQFLQGGLSVGAAGGGVAWFAHIGGFLAGGALIAGRRVLTLR